jgi:signal transduction histidine kinase
MTNISRHARAHAVEIRVQRGPPGAGALDELLFSIVDDGCGTDLGEATSGLGLIGMRERVEMLGGRLEVIAQPAQGFGILARIPLQQGELDTTA